MKRAIIAVSLVLAAFTAIGVMQAQPNIPRTMPQMRHMMQMPMMSDMASNMPMMDCMLAVKDLDVSVADTPDGIAITLKPKDPAKLDAFRKQVREHLEMMRH